MIEAQAMDDRHNAPQYSKLSSMRVYYTPLPSLPPDKYPQSTINRGLKAPLFNTKGAACEAAPARFKGARLMDVQNQP